MMRGGGLLVRYDVFLVCETGAGLIRCLAFGYSAGYAGMFSRCLGGEKVMCVVDAEMDRFCVGC